MEAATQPTRQRIVSALHHWDRHATRAHEFLATCSTQKLTSTHIYLDTSGEGVAASYAEAALERRMAASLDNLAGELDAMAAAAADLRRLANNLTDEADDEPYAVTEERSLPRRFLHAASPRRDARRRGRSLRVRAGQVADFYEKHLAAATKILDDVLWCDDGDTHSIYASVFLLQPHVPKAEARLPFFGASRSLVARAQVALLREVCELADDLAPVAADERPEDRRSALAGA